MWWIIPVVILIALIIFCYGFPEQSDKAERIIVNAICDTASSIKAGSRTAAHCIAEESKKAAAAYRRFAIFRDKVIEKLLIVSAFVVFPFLMLAVIFGL